jgi:hypothetical protein
VYDKCIFVILQIPAVKLARPKAGVFKHVFMVKVFSFHEFSAKLRWYRTSTRSRGFTPDIGTASLACHSRELDQRVGLRIRLEQRRLVERPDSVGHLETSKRWNLSRATVTREYLVGRGDCGRCLRIDEISNQLMIDTTAEFYFFLLRCVSASSSF